MTIARPTFETKRAGTSVIVECPFDQSHIWPSDSPAKKNINNNINNKSHGMMSTNETILVSHRESGSDVGNY
jgi:hypothetical protein